MTISKEQMIEIFQHRNATRYYDGSRKISDEDFAAILEFGRLSPSSVGSEPWKFVVVQNRALREKMKAFSWGMAGQLDDASHVVVILAKKNVTYDSEFILRSLKNRNLTDEQFAAALAIYKKFQLENMKLDTERALFDWACKQTYIALGNMLTGAAAIGIDSCPIEGFDYEQMNRLLADEGLLDPAEWGASVAATFGYRAKDITRKPRRAVEDVVVWAK